MMRTVAALYIDPRGPYPKMPGVECWDEVRDARTYAGPHPVVAHPPCGPWGALRHMVVPNRARRLADSELGPIAVDQVRRFGGVLEQPAGSKLWDHCGLPAANPVGDIWRHPGDGYGFAVEVEQVAWGHPARKKTWLYIVGPGRPEVAVGMRTGGVPTHWVSGGRKRSRKGRGGVVPPGIKVCSAQQRRRTPVAFAEWLVSLARASTPTAPADSPPPGASRL